jgi:outer membrane lipoprotein LolB
LFKRLYLLGLCAVLHGCAHFAQESSAPVADALQDKLYALDAWRLEGRIGVQTPQQGWSANLFWEHDGLQDRLRISGPFSQGMVSIVLQDDLIYINEGQGKEEISHDPDGALQARLGFAVPLKSLRHWILGLPAPGQAHHDQRDAFGRLTGFEQQGWVLAFERFAAVQDFVVPEKMTIRGHELKLKLIADDWALGKKPRAGG